MRLTAFPRLTDGRATGEKPTPPPEADRYTPPKRGFFFEVGTSPKRDNTFYFSKSSTDFIY
jgi:hypothetical protein